MARYGNIIMAYDGSEASMNALDQAAVLALAHRGAELTIVFVLQIPEVGVEMISINEAMGFLEDAAEKLVLEAAVRSEKEGVKARTVVRKGAPYMEITALAEEVGADLIVTGRRGMSRLERALMGSVTARVIGHTKRDVLVVPHKSKIGFDSVLVATDGSDNANHAFERALGFAVDYDSGALNSVSVVDMNAELMAQRPDVVEEITSQYEKDLETAMGRSEATGLAAEKSIVLGPVPEGIVKTAHDSGADIVFIGTHGRTGIARFIMGSVTEKVVGLSRVPVIVTRGGDVHNSS